MTNERKQSVLSNARFFKHSKTTSQLLCILFITNEQVKLVSFTWEGPISRILILAVPLSASWCILYILDVVNILGLSERWVRTHEALTLYQGYGKVLNMPWRIHWFHQSDSGVWTTRQNGRVAIRIMGSEKQLVDGPMYDSTSRYTTSWAHQAWTLSQADCIHCDLCF